MKIDASVLANLPADLELTVQVRAGDLLNAMARSGDVPEVASTVELSRAWGFTARKWREWASAGLIEGAVLDDGGSWRLPRAAAREQFERALGRDIRLTWRPDRPPPGFPASARAALASLDGPYPITENRGIRSAPPSALEAPCAVCDAVAGQPCVSGTGFVTHAHVSRLQAAHLTVLGERRRTL